MLAVGVVLLAVAAAQHQVHFWHWYIEDAAISFAYARNWAEGYGLVPLPDSERLEGYSNPTWVAVLAFFQLLGFDSFDTSKVLQVVFGFFTVVLTALVAREASPSRDDGTPVVAAGYLATASTFAVWGACGLENSLFSLILAGALLASAHELRSDARWPFSALLWFLLAISRPEAILYCALAGFWMMVFTLRRGVLPTLKWLAFFFVPFGLYHAVRFNYFAYEFPQTYYGKMGTKEPTPLAWNRRGWKQVRDWSHTVWTGYYLPLWFFGLVGWRGVRGVITLVLLGITAAWLSFPELIPHEPLVVGDYEIAPLFLPQDFPEDWEAGRSWLMVVCATFLPLLALGRRRGWGAWAVAIGLWGVAPLAVVHAVWGVDTVGQGAVLGLLPALLLLVWRLGPELLRDPPDVPTQVRVLCWSVAAGVFFFAIYTQGDWMKAWRWMSLLQVPIAIAFATGVQQLADAVDTALHRLRGTQFDERLAGAAFWAVAQLTAIVLVVVYGPRFGYGLPIAITIAVGAVLLALPLGLLRQRLGMPWTIAGWTVACLLVALTAFPNLQHTRSLGTRPETGPFSVKRRVEFVQEVRDRLELEHRIVDLDVDQGAHLWWGKDHFRMMDLAGLVDIPFAQHRFKRPFVREYVFEERRPHFAHVHGGWATNSRLKTFPEWRRQYVEIPGFPAGSKQFHIGNYVRRDLLMVEDYDVGIEPVALEDGVTFYGYAAPSEPGANRTLWLQVAFRDERRRDEGEPLNVLVMARRDGIVEKIWSVPPAYGWFLPADWRSDEIFAGHFHLDTRGLEPGTYDLGFLFFGDRRPLLPLEGYADDPEDPLGEEELRRFDVAPGELWYPEAVRVVSAGQEVDLALEDVAAAEVHAAEGRCDEAAASWDLAKRHLPINRTFHAEHRNVLHRAIARCWAERARDRPEERQTALEAARLWNHEDALYRELRGPEAQLRIDEGLAAREAGDAEAAFEAFSAALRVDPTRSWARRWAEQARSARLGLANLEPKSR